MASIAPSRAGATARASESAWMPPTTVSMMMLTSCGTISWANGGDEQRAVGQHGNTSVAAGIGHGAQEDGEVQAWSNGPPGWRPGLAAERQPLAG